MIDRSMIEEMFSRARENYSWDIDRACVWGYFFTDQAREKLLAAGKALENSGYRVVGLLHPAHDDDDQKTIVLHVERIEQHSVESLDVRNRELDAFAERFGLATYDGMDVGPIKGPA